MSYNLRFTVPDIKYIKENANLTEMEEKILEFKNAKNPLSVIEIAEKLNVSVSTVSRATKEISERIKNLL